MYLCLIYDIFILLNLKTCQNLLLTNFIINKSFNKYYQKKLTTFSRFNLNWIKSGDKLLVINTDLLDLLIKKLAGKCIIIKGITNYDINFNQTIYNLIKCSYGITIIVFTDEIQYPMDIPHYNAVYPITFIKLFNYILFTKKSHPMFIYQNFCNNLHYKRLQAIFQNKSNYIIDKYNNKLYWY